MNISLPRNGREGLVYGAIICAISCIFMATINISINMGGVSKESILLSIKSFPLVFVIAMIAEATLIGKIAEKLVSIFISADDSFNSYIMFRVFFTVIGMSAIMTIVGGILAFGFNFEVIKEFPIAWPRNFCLALFWELIVAQPIARKVMREMHKSEKSEIKVCR